MNFNELIKQVIERLGLDTERAEVAVEMTAQGLVEELEYPYSGLLQLALNGDDPAAHINYFYQALKPPVHEKDALLVYHLLNQGVDVNFADPEGETWLHLAAYWNRKNITRLLIARGAEVNALDQAGQTPVQVATCANPDLQVTKLLLEAGAEADIYTACSVGDLPRVTLLVYANAAVVHGQEFFELDTPLHKAAQFGHEAVVAELLTTEAEVTAQNRLGQTPLHKAVMFGHPQVAEQLMSHDAGVNCKDNSGYTPLDLAYFHRGGRSPVFKLLCEHKAKRSIDVHSIHYDRLNEILGAYYADLGCRIEVKMTEQGDAIEFFNIYPEGKPYFKNKVNEYAEVGQQDGALDAIKEVLFPGEQKLIRRIYQKQNGVVDLFVELLDV